MKYKQLWLKQELQAHTHQILGHIEILKLKPIKRGRKNYHLPPFHNSLLGSHISDGLKRFHNSKSKCSNNENSNTEIAVDFGY